MTPELQDALITEARRHGAVDDDVIRLDPELTQNIAPDDSERVIKALVKRHPALFKVPTSLKPWDTITNDLEWSEREAAFKEGLRRSTPIGPSEWRDLDASRLSTPELRALDKAITGNVNSFDRGVLLKARARQRGEDSQLRGDAA